MAFQVRQTSTGKLRYRLVQELSDWRDYQIVSLTRWCGSVEGARKAHKKKPGPRGEREPKFQM